MNRLHEKQDRYSEWIQGVRERAPPSDDHTPTYERLVLYHTVVEALVRSHGITDDDPERAVVEALETVRRMATATLQREEPDVPRVANKLRDRARELAEEVREA